MQRLSNKQKLWLTIIIAGIALILQYGFHYPLLAQIIVTIAGAIVALTMLVGMVKTLRSGKYGVDLLAILAVVATLAVGEYWAAMVILVMLTGGDALEDYAAKKANTELKALLDNSPRFAHVVTPDGSKDVPVNDVPVGAKIIVKPGELVPIDGLIIKGTGEFDESSLTGEARPVAKTVGDTVMSGSINGDEAITLTVTKLAKDSQYQQLVKLVQEAEQTPAHFVRLADRYAVPFTVAAILVSLLAWWLSKERLLHLAASAEQDSSHILARSLLAYASQHNISLAAVSGLTEETGKGITAMIEDHQVKVGKRQFVAPQNQQAALDTTAIYVSVDGTYYGAIAFTDHVRPEAAQTMTKLKAAGVTNLIMLTGDQRAIAQQVAKAVGIPTVKADLLPQDKIAALQSIPQSEHPVFMVGDGVNDAPSLATADVGIAMGAHGSTAASETADVVILKDDLAKVAKAVTISQDTLRIAKQAVLIGIAICTVLMLIASTGVIPAFVGAMLQEVIDTVSILWALKARQLHN